MSLVAYTVDSDEESEQENTDDESSKTETTVSANASDSGNKQTSEGILSVLSQLPPPKKRDVQFTADVEEANDEFLHKTAVYEKDGLQESTNMQSTTNKVKIVIPSMREYDYLDAKYNSQGAAALAARRLEAAVARGSKLLSILPKAKSEQNFAKAMPKPTERKTSEAKSTVKATPVTVAFVPDCVRFGRAARSTEAVEESAAASRSSATKRIAQKPINNAKDDESDEEEDSADFFSLNSAKNAEELPQISTNEINELLTARSAKIATSAEKYLQQQKLQDKELTTTMPDAQHNSQTINHSTELDEVTLQALAGRNAAKRARRGEECVQIMDISGAEIQPKREEWMRTALASSTAYQPTGVLVDEEPVVGTRRKHQITYLAHKAKANEAELQAMWAANRQTRRATQSKYGF